MIERLLDLESIETAARLIGELMAAHGEWLFVHGGRTASLSRDECDLRVSNGRLLFNCWGDAGAASWRVTGWEWTGSKLLLEATRRAGAERARLELIPRSSYAAAAAELVAAREERCRRLAQLAAQLLQGATIERAGLSPGMRRGQPGSYARITLLLGRVRVAVTGVVSLVARQDVDAFLCASLLWFERERSRRRPAERLWLIVDVELAGPMAERLALLREELRRVVRLYSVDEGLRALLPAAAPGLDELLAARHAARFRLPLEGESLSVCAEQIAALAPEAIDVVRSRHGETLRYLGLAFARVRRVMGKEAVWFGVEGARRRLLNRETLGAWEKLLRELFEHRHAGASDRSHALYRAAPESWLESMLRRDITRLDPGLRLAPLYAQFRPAQTGSSRPIDLLALRRDGRLAVVELKVAEDREHVLQGADYWRRVEAHRRRGSIQRSGIFGGAEIADEPPLVYLVAPTLSFHRSLHTLARAITPAIELYRFDLNEDWREGVRVTRRCALT